MSNLDIKNICFGMVLKGIDIPFQRLKCCEVYKHRYCKDYF